MATTYPNGRREITLDEHGTLKVVHHQAKDGSFDSVVEIGEWEGVISIVSYDVVRGEAREKKVALLETVDLPAVVRFLRRLIRLQLPVTDPKIRQLAIRENPNPQTCAACQFYVNGACTIPGGACHLREISGVPGFTVGDLLAEVGVLKTPSPLVVEVLRCPACKSRRVGQYRMLTGAIWCMACGHRVERKEFDKSFIAEVAEGEEDAA